MCIIIFKKYELGLIDESVKWKLKISFFFEKYGLFYFSRCIQCKEIKNPIDGGNY